jgi:hypothetical protein
VSTRYFNIQLAFLQKKEMAHKEAEKAIFEKLATQVPVTVAELRTLWLDMVKSAKATPPEKMPSKEEIDSKMAYFKAPQNDDEMLEILRKKLSEIIKRFDEQDGKIDATLAELTYNYLSGSQAIGRRDTSPAACRRNMLNGAQCLRRAWEYCLPRIKENYLYTTAAVKAWTETDLEPDFEGILKHLAELPAMYLEAERFAQRIEVPATPPSATSCYIM